MPQWASEELYNQLQFFNRLWRDGLMSPGAFLDPGAFEGDLAAGQYSVMAGHGGYSSGAGYRDHLKAAMVDKLGPDHEDVKKYQAQGDHHDAAADRGQTGPLPPATRAAST